MNAEKGCFGVAEVALVGGDEGADGSGPEADGEEVEGGWAEGTDVEENFEEVRGERGVGVDSREIEACKGWEGAFDGGVGEAANWWECVVFDFAGGDLGCNREVVSSAVLDCSGASVGNCMARASRASGMGGSVWDSSSTRIGWGYLWSCWCCKAWSKGMIVNSERSTGNTGILSVWLRDAGLA